MTRELAITILTGPLGYSLREVEKDPIGILEALRKRPELGRLNVGNAVAVFGGLRAFITDIDYVAGTFTARVVNEEPGSGSPEKRPTP